MSAECIGENCPRVLDDDDPFDGYCGICADSIDAIGDEVPEDCRCDECREVHADFIAHFGRWPDMSHDDAMALRDRRERNEASWSRVLGP